MTKVLVPSRKQNRKQDGIYANLEFMHGDADGDSFLEVGPYTEAEVERLISTIERYMGAEVEGDEWDEDRDNYDPNYEWLFGEEWPTDMTRNMYKAELRDVEYYRYHNGQKIDLEVQEV